MNAIYSGALQRVHPGENKIVGTVLYPGPQLDHDNKEVTQVWLSAQAGDSDQHHGLVLTVEDTLQNPVAGPLTVFGTGVPQLVRLLPLDRKPLRGSGPPFQVLVVRAHNKATEDYQTAFVGDVCLMVGDKV